MVPIVFDFTYKTKGYCVDPLFVLMCIQSIILKCGVVWTDNSPKQCKEDRVGSEGPRPFVPSQTQFWYVKESRNLYVNVKTPFGFLSTKKEVYTVQTVKVTNKVEVWVVFISVNGPFPSPISDLLGFQDKVSFIP